MSLSDVYLKAQFVIVPCHSFTIGCGESSYTEQWGKPQRVTGPSYADRRSACHSCCHQIQAQICFDEIKILLKWYISIWLRGEAGLFSLLVLTCVSSYVWLRCWWLCQVFGRWQVSKLQYLKAWTDTQCYYEYFNKPLKFCFFEE